MNNKELYDAVYPCFVESEINRIQEHNKTLRGEGYKPSIQVSFDGVKTKNLAVSFEQLEQIKNLLIGA